MNQYPSGGGGVAESYPWYMQFENASEILMSAPDVLTKGYARNFLEQGYVVLPASLPDSLCDEAVDSFHGSAEVNPQLFRSHLDAHGHYPRIVNLHLVIPTLLRLFTENKAALTVQDFLFGAETTLYISLFYERGSAQDLYRDTPYF